MKEMKRDRPVAACRTRTAQSLASDPECPNQTRRSSSPGVMASSRSAKLTAGSNGALDEADYKRTVGALMSGGSDPVITAEPTGAWTHQITDKALQ